MSCLSYLDAKLMQLDRPPAKIRSKSYSNCLLIDFCDSIPAVRSIVATISIQFRIQILILNSILYQKTSMYIKKVQLYRKLVQFDRKRRFISKTTIFDQIRPIFDIIELFWLINRHLVDLNQSFNRYYIKKINLNR